MSNKRRASAIRRAGSFLLTVSVCSVCAGVYAQENFHYDDESRRNPFIALVTSDGRLVKFNDEQNFTLMVEGIVMDVSGDAYALVTGSIVREGDLVGGYEVFKIEKNKVIFKKDGQLKQVEFTTEEGEK